MIAEEAREMILSVSAGRMARRTGTVTCGDVLYAALPDVLYGPNYRRAVASAFVDAIRFSKDADTIRFDHWIEQLRARIAPSLAHG